MSDSSLLLPPGTQLGEYTILHSLGQGGFGVTYLATDAVSGQKVVIKENLPSDFAFRDSEVSLNVKTRNSSGSGSFEWAMNNFLNEAQTLSALSHPGIVKVLRAFAAFNTAYFVMPYVEGDSLDKYRDKHGAPTEEWVRGTLRALLEALKYLHGKNLLHRDIKPGNILLSKEGEPILIDFGTARQLLSEKSQTVIESPGYPPFDQMQSHGKVGPWTDLYALGATMYKLITGDTPPKNADRVGKYDPCTPLSKRSDLKQSYSKQLLADIDKAMSLWPDDRWQNAEEWLERLSSVVAPHSNAATEGSMQALQRQNSLLEEKIRRMEEKIRRQEEPKKRNRSLMPLYIMLGCMTLALVFVGVNLLDREKTELTPLSRTPDIAQTEPTPAPPAVSQPEKEPPPPPPVVVRPVEPEPPVVKKPSLGTPLGVPMKHDNSVSSLSFSPDGSKIVSGSFDHTLRIWDAETGQELKRMEHDDVVYSVNFSPDGRKIVSGSYDNTLRIWDAETGRELKSMMHDFMVNSVSFSPDGSKIVSGSWDDTVRIWDAETGRELKRMKHDKWVNSVSFSPDGSKIVSGSEDKTIRIWDAETGRELKRMEHENNVESVSFSPDGSKIVSGSDDKTLRIWDAETGRELKRMKHENNVESVSFSPDGSKIVSGSRDKTLRIWDAETGQELKRMKHDNEVRSVSYSPDGSKIVSGSGYTIRIWQGE